MSSPASQSPVAAASRRPVSVSGGSKASRPGSGSLWRMRSSFMVGLFLGGGRAVSQARGPAPVRGHESLVLGQENREVAVVLRRPGLARGEAERGSQPVESGALEVAEASVDQVRGDIAEAGVAEALDDGPQHLTGHPGLR